MWLHVLGCAVKKIKMVSTAYKGRKTNITNFLGRRIHFQFCHSTFCTFNSLFTSKPRIPICRNTEMSKGLICQSLPGIRLCTFLSCNNGSVKRAKPFNRRYAFTAVLRNYVDFIDISERPDYYINIYLLIYRFISVYNSGFILLQLTGVCFGWSIHFRENRYRK